MLPEPQLTASTDPAREPRAMGRMGLLAATLRCDEVPYACATLVADLDAAAVRRLRQDALAMRARYGRPITIEARFVASPEALALLATLEDLATHDIHVVPSAIAALDRPRLDEVRASLRAPEADAADVPGLAAPAADPATSVAPAPDPIVPEPAASAVATAAPYGARRVSTPDPFGFDPEFRRGWLTPLRFVFERYWRVGVSGMEHVPDDGPVLIVANHSGAVPADAFMLSVALELRKPARVLRVLYDRFVDALPIIGPTYRRLGAVSASLPNAEELLARGEAIGLFPEGIAGVEKRCTERYQLRPFKSGTARLAVRTGAPIIPVSIVGAEEAFPVIARLYRVGKLVGVPWIPITPTFPLCGLAGALPLPTRWSMHFGEPIVAPPSGEGRSEDERIAETTGRVRTAIEAGLSDLLAKRRGIFV
jgi:1-acyl-sn-glycerol-3-phosphate acyltransferase